MVKLWLLIGLLGVLNIHQQQVWKTDEALWAQAVMSSSAPRPALNYAIALRKVGHLREAAVWAVEAADRSTGRPREAEWRKAVAVQIEAIEMSGLPICDSPSAQPYCWP